MSGLLIPNEYYKAYCNTLNAINMEVENVIIENLTVNNLVANTETVNTLTATNVTANNVTIQTLTVNTETVNTLNVDTETVNTLTVDTETVDTITANIETVNSISINTDLIANQLSGNRPVYTSTLKRLMSFDTPYFHASSDSFNFTGGQKIIPFINFPSNLFTNSGAPNYYISPLFAGIYKFDIIVNLVSVLDDADPSALPAPIYILLVNLLDASDTIIINSPTDSTKFLLANSVTLEQYPATLNGTGLFSMPVGYKIQIILDPDSTPLNVNIDSLFCRVVITFIAPL